TRLGLAAGLHRLVVVGDRPGHGVVRARQRKPGGPGRFLDDELRGGAAWAGRLRTNRGGRVLTCREPGDDSCARDRPGGAAGKLATGDPGSILWMRHFDSLSLV